MKKTILYIILALSLASCRQYENIEIKKVTSVDFRGFSNNKVRLNISMLIDNPSYLNLHLREIDLKVYINKRYVGKITNAESLKIKRRKLDNYTLETELRIANVFSGISSVMALKNSSNVDLKMEGSLKIRSSLWIKSIEISEEQELN